jgi:SpoVK/Ycf46/Vps4 family AAA+-type ATPase
VPHAGERFVQACLGTREYTRAHRCVPVLLGNILLRSLEGFLVSRPLTIEGSLRVQYRGVVEADMAPASAETRLIEIAPGRKGQVLNSGLLVFADPAGRRSILEVDAADPNGEQVSLALLTTTLDADAFFEEWEGYAAAHAYLRGRRFYASGEFVKTDPPIRLKDVYLPPATRERIERTIVGFAARAVHFRRRRLSCKRGVLLEGPPGTGKTMLCRALASELDATFVWVTARHVEQDADRIAAIWRLARMLQPTVILLEDLDLFAESRQHAYTSHVLGELMNQMDGVEDNDGLLTLATTNRVEVVEKALRNRPGRFDRVIHFEPPDEPGRRDLLARFLAHDRVPDHVMETLVLRTDGFTGARLADLAKTVVEVACGDEPESPEVPLTISQDVAERALAELLDQDGEPTMGFARTSNRQR